MAQIPPSAGSSFNFGAFFVQLGANYLVSRLTAMDGPRLANLEAGGGDYGVALPRAYGEDVRLTGIFIGQADIKETKHTVEDYSELVGAATGAIQGFMIGGPIGAVVGGIVGGLFGAATPNQHYYTYSDTFALLLSDRTDDDPVEGVKKLFGAGKLLFDSSAQAPVATTTGGDGKLVSVTYGQNRWFKSLTLYTGHMEQPVDPVLTSVLEETSGYRPMAYVVIEDLQLEQFGQSLPNPIDVLFTAKVGDTLVRVAEVVALAAGIDNIRDISTTALADKTIRGYAVTGESNCWDALRPLMPVFAVDAAEVAGEIRFIRRAQHMRANIPAADMGGHAYGDDPSPAIRFSRSTDIDLPRESSLTFLDPERDYQPNTATATRSEGSAKSNISTSIPLVLTADEGASAAATIHWDAWLGRTPAKFSLTDKWISIAPGVAYALPSPGGPVPFRITRKLRGDSGIIECEAVSDEAVAYNAVVAGSSGIVPPPESTIQPDTRVVFIDMPITADAHDDYGFYIAVAGSEAYWTRGYVEISADEVTWYKLVDTSDSAVIGDVSGTLAAGVTSGLDDELDATSVLTVVLLHDQMSLSSATDAELDAWANFAFVGKNGKGEYLQFKTATKVAPRTWELTGLRRGRKGTDWALGAHVAAEEFVLLGSSGIFRIVYGDAAKWGASMTLRGVTLLADPAAADEVAFANTGEGKRPYSPVDVEGSWDGSNNVTISWTYRSRMNSGALGVDDRDEYEVEITSGVGRTIIASGVESADYSAADQTADGITLGDSISGRVRQTSDVNNGRWRNFTLIGPNAKTADTTAFTADTTLITADMA